MVRESFDKKVDIISDQERVEKDTKELPSIKRPDTEYTCIEPIPPVPLDTCYNATRNNELPQTKNQSLDLDPKKLEEFKS